VAPDLINAYGGEWIGRLRIAWKAMKRLYTKLLRPALAGGLMLGAFSVTAAAQTSRWSAPTLGFVYDADSKSIRTLSGVIGAASLEGGIAVSSKLDKASLSPNRQLALAESADSDHLLLVRWDGKAGSAEPLDGAPNTADLIAWSPDGSTAAVYNTASQQLWVWKSLGTEPALIQQSSASSLRALAVADDGFAVGSTDSGLYQLAAENRLVSETAYSALAFAPGSHDLAAGNSVLNQVVLLRDFSADAQSVLATASDGVAQPIAIAYSRDGLKLAVANASSKSVLLIDNATSTRQVFSCDCNPDGVFAAAGNAVFRLTNTGQDRLTLLDADSAEARLLSIPVGDRQ
jgi:WD40 repeat protein